MHRMQVATHYYLHVEASYMMKGNERLSAVLHRRKFNKFSSWTHFDFSYEFKACKKYKLLTSTDVPHLPSIDAAV